MTKENHNELISTIDFLGSEGLEINLTYNGERFCNTMPQLNEINHIITSFSDDKKYITALNNKHRLTQPLKKIGADFVEISFQEAFEIIENTVKQANAYENAFFAGARLSNEELYLIQKLARVGVKSNNIGSFHYLKRDSCAYNLNKNDNVQLHEIEGSKNLFLIGNVLNDFNLLTQALVQEAHLQNKIPVTLISVNNTAKLPAFMEKNYRVNSYYHLFKALNYFILKKKLQYGIFVEALHEQFQTYAKQLLEENFEQLLQNANISLESLSSLAKQCLIDKSCIFIYTESETTEHTVKELLNLCLLTEKLGFPNSGVLGLKEKNNSQGLFDMGINSRYGVGFRTFSEDYLTLLKNIWKTSEIATQYVDVFHALKNGESKNVFIFGEDPIGCTQNSAYKNLLNKAQFIVVQDYFLTKTAKMADIILPATFPFETGGSFTNTTKIVQTFSKEMNAPVAMNNIEQLSQLGIRFGLPPCETQELLFLEFGALFQSGCNGKSRHHFVYTLHDSEPTFFSGGCDAMMHAEVKG